MNKQLEEIVVRQIKKLRQKCGATCMFVPIGRIGVKFYHSAKARDWAFAVQKYAALFDLAPRCCNLFETDNEFIVWHYDLEMDQMDLSGQTKAYGFITQRARMTKKTAVLENSIERKRRLKITRKLREIGIYHEDIHEENYGHLNGRLVCIDFDMECCRLENEESVMVDVGMA